LLAGHIFPSR